MKPKEIREERQKRGLSQASLARQLGVRRQTISDWERGINTPHQIFVQQLSLVFTRDETITHTICEKI